MTETLGGAPVDRGAPTGDVGTDTRSKKRDRCFSHPCGASWTGVRAAHCPTCHRTFGGVWGFTRHRRNGACLDPATVGLALLAGIWRNPIPAAELARRRSAEGHTP